MAYPYYQSLQQPYFYQTPPTPPQTTYQAPQPTMIWVNGQADVDTYPVAPNGAVTFWKKDLTEAYIKQADQTGRPTVRVYDLVERKETVKEKPTEYATAADLQALKSEFETLRASLDKKDGDAK